MVGVEAGAEGAASRHCLGRELRGGVVRGPLLVLEASDLTAKRTRASRDSWSRSNKKEQRGGKQVRGMVMELMIEFIRRVSSYYS